MSSFALQLPQRSVLWLFDCGEGTQHQILRSPLRLSQLERVFISHLHGDHLFGLPGLLASRSLQNSASTPVILYGPQGLEEFIRVSLGLSETHLSYPLEFVRLRSGILYEDTGFCVECLPMAHRIEAFGFSIREKDQPGTFDVERARTLGVPEGPLFGRLKRGETITLPDGRQVEGPEMVGPPHRGRKLVYCGDTAATPNAALLAQDADVLIHEATHLQEDSELSIRSAHSTAAMAADVARQAGVRRLILTHFSARYESDTRSRMPELLAEAQAVFPETQLASDLWSYEIPRTEAGDGVEPRR